MQVAACAKVRQHYPISCTVSNGSSSFGLPALASTRVQRLAGHCLPTSWRPPLIGKAFSQQITPGASRPGAMSHRTAAIRRKSWLGVRPDFSVRRMRFSS
jgi:hypothetical protein